MKTLLFAAATLTAFAAAGTAFAQRCAEWSTRCTNTTTCVAWDEYGTCTRSETTQNCTQVCVRWEQSPQHESVLPAAGEIKGTPELNAYLTGKLTKDAPAIRVETVDGVIVKEERLK